MFTSKALCYSHGRIYVEHVVSQQPLPLTEVLLKLYLPACATSVTRKPLIELAIKRIKVFSRAPHKTNDQLPNMQGIKFVVHMRFLQE